MQCWRVAWNKGEIKIGRKSSREAKKHPLGERVMLKKET